MGCGAHGRFRRVASGSVTGLVLAGLLGGVPASRGLAAEDPIATDRPDQTESPNVIERGRVQIEGGFLFARDTREGNVNTLKVPQALLRIGLLRNVELRIGGDGFVYQGRSGEKGSGNGSVITLGTKFRLTD